MYLYRTYLYLYRNSWPRGNIQSGWCCYWPIWRRFKSCAEVIFGLCPFSMCVLFGEDFIPKNCVALNAPQITAIGFCQEVNNWPFFAKLWGEGSHIWSQLLQVNMYIISYFISYCCRLAFYWVENRARLRLTYLACVQKLLRSQSIFEQTTHL